MAAVERDGTSLRFASDDLKADRAVVAAAVSNDKKAIREASVELREEYRATGTISVPDRDQKDAVDADDGDWRNDIDGGFGGDGED